ncbi:tape measure protein [Anaerosinus massiliensis]|uniref:tape measure protein n=1 Tax=Massilibacillus massiliensis TaxID=1806837 RepID=UPI000DA62B3B|nr:tape measure protein [Massilibacillus massiliensis]
MATIQDSISLRDGVSGTLARMASGFDNIARVAGFTNERLNEVERPRSISMMAGNFNNSMNSINNQLNNLSNKTREVMSSTAGQFAAGEIMASSIMKVFRLIQQIPGRVIAASDEYSGIQARIKLITDDATGMNNSIYQSALRARGSYAGMADAVSKIGLTARETFKDTNQIVPFTENIQKLFAIGGTGKVQQQDAMLQLTQALGSGKLQGDEFRSIAEAAPLIEQMVAKYMGVTQGELKKLSSEGEVTAEVMKNAILGATDEINEKFDTIPLKWQDISQNIETVAFKAFTPVWNEISAIANSPTMKAIGENVGLGLQVAGLAIAGVINNLRWLGGIVTEYGYVFEPVFVGMGLVMLGVAANIGLATIAAIGHTIASEAETLAILGLILAQDGLNAALYACPLTWFVIGIIAIVGVFYLAVAAVNRFAGTSISATGIVVGAFFWLGGMIYNVIALAWNILVSFAESLGNLFRNPTAAIYNFFATIWNGIVELVGRSINEIIGLINKLPGMEMGFINWGKGLAKKMTIQGGIDLSAYNMDYSSGNFMKGYGYGTDLAGRLSDLVGAGGDDPKNNHKYAGPDYEAGPEKVKPVHVRGGKLDKDQEIQLSEENLKTLTDLAQREVQLHYQQITPQIQISFGDVRETANVDEIMERIGDHITNIHEGNLVTS